jgi:hypothetical protein
MALQKSPTNQEKSAGGLNPTKMAGSVQAGPGGTLESNVSGHALPGKAPKAGAGPDSPSVKTPANQAASGGRIQTAGQARGGPRQMSDAVGTPGSGTKAGKGTGKAGGSL